MHQVMKIVGYTVATVGFAYVVKHMKRRKEGSRGWHKIKVEDEKRTGSRYGSNPVKY